MVWTSSVHWAQILVFKALHIIVSSFNPEWSQRKNTKWKAFSFNELFIDLTSSFRLKSSHKVIQRQCPSMSVQLSSFTSDFLPIDHNSLPWIPISNKETHQIAEYANNCLVFPTECIDVTLKWCQKGLTTRFCRVCSCGINHQDKLTLLLLCSWTLIHLPYSSLPQWLRSDEANNKVPSGKWIAYMQFANTW